MKNSSATGPRIVHIDLEKLAKDAKQKYEHPVGKSKMIKEDKSQAVNARVPTITAKQYQSQKGLATNNQLY